MVEVAGRRKEEGRVAGGRKGRFIPQAGVSNIPHRSRAAASGLFSRLACLDRPPLPQSGAAVLPHNFRPTSAHAFPISIQRRVYASFLPRSAAAHVLTRLSLSFSLSFSLRVLTPSKIRTLAVARGLIVVLSLQVAKLHDQTTRPSTR